MENLVIFDFDGVLADTLDEMLHIAGLVCEMMGYPCTPSPSDLDVLRKMEFRELGKQLGIPEQHVDEFVERTFDMFGSRPVPPRIFPGMREVVTTLSKDHKIAILTGNTFQVVDRFLVANDLSAVIAVVMSADEPGSRSEKLSCIVSQLGGPGVQSYLVGDAVSDVQVARTGGVTSIAVTWGHQSENRLLSVDPDYLVHTPLELLALFQNDGNETVGENHEKRDFD